jgi:hypothetical protein
MQRLKLSVGELLRYQRTAGLGIAELLAQALERLAHGGLVRLAADVDDGRQRVQEHLGVAACLQPLRVFLHPPLCGPVPRPLQNSDAGNAEAEHANRSDSSK